MEGHIDRLVKQTWEKYQTLDLSRRLLIAISGIPGSGKTTLAAEVVSRLNKLHRSSPDHTDPSQPDIAYVVPLDGYHLTRHQLSLLPNSDEALFRRGAAFTFDAKSFHALVQKIREPLTPETQTIHAPSFDHSVKDPIQNDIAIPPTARIVLFEGLYVALDEPGWREANKLMDETWFVDVSIATATERVAKRNFGAGISASLEESLKRTEASDMRNARHVLDNRLPVQEVIPSLEDESWRSEEVMRVDDDLREQKLNEQELRRGRMERMDSIALLAEDGVGL